MAPTANGYAPVPGMLKKQLNEMHDLFSPEMPDWDLIEFDPLLDSSNISYEQWNMMAETIESHYDDYDGFVILHGTDTMSYSASALSFMLKGLDKPVIFTGSQIPLCRLRSDGKDNIITSIMVAADGVAKEVCLYFSNKLLRANRSTKVSADELVAFDSPNYPELALAGTDIDYRIRTLPEAGKAGSPRDTASPEHFRVIKMKDFRIGVVKLFPGIQFDLFEPMVSSNLDGLILETFGTGNIPSNSDMPRIISEAVSNETVVVVCTQCLRGNVRLGAYEAGSALISAGAVSGRDMTTEAAVTKLLCLLSQGIDKAEVARLMQKNLRGELTEEQFKN